MKTPREILLQKHRSTQSKLDAIRHAAIAKTKIESGNSRVSLGHILRSLRWHLAGMSAAWMLILILHADTGQAPLLAAAIPEPPPPHIMMASLREHRRKLAEMTDWHPPDGERHELILPKPRSEWHREFSIA